VDGLPRLRRRPAGLAAVCPWDQQPRPLQLDPPGQQGQDRLRLRFSIKATGELVLEGDDLATGQALPVQPLGPVR
jgi:hypothetical protein